MERINRIEQLQERAERSPGKARKAGLPPWYKPQELQKIGIELNKSHCNSRSDGLQYRHGQPQDRDVTPSDGDYEYGLPAFGSGFTPHLDASASSASDQGTLAGGGCLSRDPVMENYNNQLRRQNPEAFKDRQKWASFQSSYINKEVAQQKKDSKQNRQKIGQWR